MQISNASTRHKGYGAYKNVFVVHAWGAGAQVEQVVPRRALRRHAIVQLGVASSQAASYICAVCECVHAYIHTDEAT